MDINFILVVLALFGVYSIGYRCQCQLQQVVHLSGPKAAHSTLCGWVLTECVILSCAGITLWLIQRYLAHFLQILHVILCIGCCIMVYQLYLKRPVTPPEYPSTTILSHKQLVYYGLQAVPKLPRLLCAALLWQTILLFPEYPMRWALPVLLLVTQYLDGCRRLPGLVSTPTLDTKTPAQLLHCLAWLALGILLLGYVDRCVTLL